MSVKYFGGNRLFWKITAVFTTLLIILGIVFVLLASRFSRSYYMMAHQELYGSIAKHLASFTQPFKNGKPDTAVTHDIIHSTMVANPSVEVYLLDTSGNIVDYVVPDKTVQIHHVNIAKVKQWLTADAMNKPLGDNPKSPGKPSIFSAAPVYENSRLQGYVYAVLSSEKQQEILSAINRQFYFRISVSIFLIALLVALIVGIVIFFLMTNSISKITAVVKRFKEGDYNARIEEKEKGDLGILGATFNEMANVIVANFEKISATDKFRQELIANVSHDLRTPLSIMQGYVETLMIKKNTLSPIEKEQFLSIINESAQKLSSLVEQLFQYAKLEANLIMPEKELFMINELVSDILMSYQLKAEEKNIHLKMEAANSLPPVFADLALTERVFQNLLDNAFKFTPTGGQISIALEKTKLDVMVKVTDTGVGIAPEEQAFVFERYKQLDSKNVQKKGMGIGLAIVKKIIELHQSTIEVFSEQGKGTVFTFALPLGKEISWTNV